MSTFMSACLRLGGRRYKLPVHSEIVRDANTHVYELEAAPQVTLDDGQAVCAHSIRVFMPDDDSAPLQIILCYIDQCQFKEVEIEHFGLSTEHATASK